MREDKRPLFEWIAKDFNNVSIIWDEPRQGSMGAIARDKSGRAFIYINPVLPLEYVYDIFLHELAHSLQPNFKVGGLERLKAGKASCTQPNDKIENKAWDIKAQIEDDIFRTCITYKLEYKRIDDKLQALGIIAHKRANSRDKYR